MTDYDDELTGVLFPNKSDNPKAPAFTGKCQINDEEYRIAGWKRVSNGTGKAFISLKFESEAERASRLADAEDADALEI